jgi:hypothetical protein
MAITSNAVPAVPQAIAPRQRRWLSSSVRVTIGMLVLLVLIAAAAVPWWLSNPERLGSIVASLLPDLDGTVTFDRVRIGWTGPILIEGIKIVPRDGSKPPITIAQVEGTHGLLAMLSSGGDLGRLAVDGLAVDLVLDKNHGTNLEQLFGLRESVDAAPALPTPRRAPVTMRLDVEDAVVRITAPWTIDSWVSDPISIRATLAPAKDGASSEWTIDPVQILADTRMDPPVAWGVLAYIAPVLADATRTSGRFSLALDGARLPVGDPASGTLSGVLSMHEVILGPGPLVTSLVESLPPGFPRPTAIRIADESNVTFRLADRKIWHEGLAFGVPLPVEGRRLDIHSSGSVALDDRALDLQLSLPIPADLPQDRPVLAALSGKTISVGVAGNLDAPQVTFDGSIGQAATQVATELLGKVPELLERVRGERPVVPASATDTARATDGAARPPVIRQEEIVDIVGNVIDEVARRRAERRAAEEAGDVSPRRGRLRDRILRPQAPQPQPHE